MSASPWWYRGRGYAIGCIYMAGFFVGSWLARSAPGTAQPLYAIAGERWGIGTQIPLIIATLLVVACWAMRAWGSSYLRAGIVWNADARTDDLLIDGPFRYVRNPLYFGNILLAIGIGALAPPVGFAIIVLGNYLFLTMLIAHEETGLRHVYGTAFDAYRARVPALFPRLLPIEPDARRATHPSLLQGVYAEVLSASLALGMIGVCLFHRRAIVVLIALCIGGWIAQHAIARALRVRPTSG